MIIFGYPGIGKSTLGGKNSIIDLESSLFKTNRNWSWYIPYCNVADSLSRQGYIVFVSSHEEVRRYLQHMSTESMYIIMPAPQLRDSWIKRLRLRYINTVKTKDYSAWQNAETSYTQNIKDLCSCGIQYYRIDDMDYVLQDIVDYLVDFDNEWHK